MNAHIKKTFLHSIAFTLFNIILNFAFKIYVAKIIEKDILALYFTAIDLISLALLILIGFRSSMVVAYSQTKDDLKILNIFRYVLIAIILICWAFLIPYIKHQIGVDINYWYLVVLILSTALYTYLTNQLAMYRLYDKINQLILLEPIFVIIWFFVAYKSVSDTKALITSYTLSMISISIYIIIKKRKMIKEPAFKLISLNAEMKSFLKNSIISTIEFASGMFILYLAVIFIMKFFSNEELGDFQVVVKPILMYMIMLFVFPIFRFLLPELSFLIAKKDINEVLIIKRYVYIFSFIVSLSFIFLSFAYSKELIEVMFSIEYIQSYLMIEHLSLFFIFIMLNGYQIAFIKASGDFISALWVRVFGVVAFVITFFVIHMFSKSIVSIVIALDGAYLSMFIISFFIEKKWLKKLKETK